MTRREVSAAVLLAGTAGLALLAVLVHYAFMAEYGDVTGVVEQGLSWEWTAVFSAVALVPVVVVAVLAFILSSRRWMRVTAVAIPVVMLAGILAVTP